MIDEKLKEYCDDLNKLLKLVPEDLNVGEEVIKECPFCNSKLTIARARYNGHLWITCEKEGRLLIE